MIKKEFAEKLKSNRDILYPYGELDVLNYYAKVTPYLRNFLRNKKIATKVHLSNMFFLKRGSNSEPLDIEDFQEINENMMKLRKFHLKEVREKLSKKQELIWTYFPPRKLVQFFYACNDEGVKKPIERIFIDIDRKKQSADDARIVTIKLIEIIKKDNGFNNKLKYEIFILWTGKSFHVYLLLKKNINEDFYENYLSYGKMKEESFIVKWASEISKETKIKVSAGHEKSEKFIILDSSNTPSGKLARVPFSLHIENFRKWDGVSVPVNLNELKEKNLIKKLEKLTPEKVLKNLIKYAKLL